ncbi:MAG: hypothetical protein ACLPSW_23580 [Roseiarcus sp.]
MGATMLLNALRPWLLAGLLLAGLGTADAAELVITSLSPSVNVYGIDLQPEADLALSAVTSKASAHVNAKISLSANTARLTKAATAAINASLPLVVDKAPCKLHVLSIGSLDLSVVAHTGIAKGVVSVGIEGCPLVDAQVPFEARFVPKEQGGRLAVDLRQLNVEIPFEWQLVGFFSGKDIVQAIRDGVKQKMASFDVKLPVAPDLQAAFQGARLDAKGDSASVYFRIDAIVGASYLAQLINTKLSDPTARYVYPPSSAPN